MKRRDESDASTDLYHQIITCAPSPDELAKGIKFVVEEFGLKADAALSPDMLVKQVVKEVQSEGWTAKSETTTEVFLCYSWKLSLPFVVIRQRKLTKESHYTPQYGRDNNYYDVVKQETTHKICSVEELPHRCPKLVPLLKRLE